MDFDRTIVKSAHALNSFMHDNASDYCHTRPVVESESSLIIPGHRKHKFKAIYDLKDILFIGAITESPVLLTGGTDTGKTTLAKLVMNGLLGAEGKGWHKLDFDNDFSRDSYTDVEFDFLNESGKKLSDIYSLHSWMKLPGFIGDELNRAHPKILSKALHIFLEKDLTLPDGKRARIGHELGNGRTYQYQIATINEGYAGTFDMDQALRRRTTIEVPLDIFPLTAADRLMLQERNGKEPSYANKDSSLDTILRIQNSLYGLSIHPTAEMFLNFLGAFDYCKNSYTGDKGAVATRNGSVYHVCTRPITVGTTPSVGDMGCVFLRSFENDLCPHVRGISPGITKNLISVAKGFALLRATKFVEMMDGYLRHEASGALSYDLSHADEFTASLQKYVGQKLEGKSLAKAAVAMYVDNLEVMKEDVESALGFVAYSKIGIAPAWIIKHYQGNRYAAIQRFAKEADTKFEEGLARPELQGLEEILTGKASKDQVREVQKYCKQQNPWLGKVLEPYLTGTGSESGKDGGLSLYD